MQAFKFGNIRSTTVRTPKVATPSFNLNSGKNMTQFSVRKVAPVFSSSFFLPMRSFSGAMPPLTQQDVTDRVLHIVKNFHRVQSTNEVKPETHFTNDLGLDSLDQVEIMMAIEDEFLIEIPDADADKMHTPADAIKYIMTVPWAK
jgi:NADH dehydrogenase (ubiquinone) 1 alpha/beta subcomplex 1